MNNIGILDSIQVIHGPLQAQAEVPSDWLELALKLTMGFEGTNWGTVAGNFDGMGISAGILQWNYGQGSLQSKILQPYINRYGTQKLDAHFKTCKPSESAYLAPKQAVAWAKKNALTPAGVVKQAEDWIYFMSRKSVIEIQKEAAKSLACRAFNDAVDSNLCTIKAFCWFFDVYVQNGSLKGIAKPELTVAEKIKTLMMNISGGKASEDLPGPVKADLVTYEKNLMAEADEKNFKVWKSIPFPTEETQILFNWICERAVKNRWRSDVIARKGTIAHGEGWVHGRLYDLSLMGMEVTPL